jgi:hypothetical protein
MSQRIERKDEPRSHEEHEACLFLLFHHADLPVWDVELQTTASWLRDFVVNQD